MKRDFNSKILLIFISILITFLYVLIYFFFFAFLGTWQGDDGQTFLLTYFFASIAIFIIVIYKVCKSENTDWRLMLYNQFNILKWSSLITLVIGVFSTFFYYRNGGFGSWIAMIINDVILFAVYKIFDNLANKIQNSITDNNLNRLIQERSNSNEKNANNILSSNNINIADELKKIKDLHDQGVLTQEEFDKLKLKLIQS